eukprot:5351765-Prymnesium_polylepis.1
MPNTCHKPAWLHAFVAAWGVLPCGTLNGAPCQHVAIVDLGSEASGRDEGGGHAHAVASPALEQLHSDHVTRQLLLYA